MKVAVGVRFGLALVAPVPVAVTVTVLVPEGVVLVELLLQPFAAIMPKSRIPSAINWRPRTVSFLRPSASRPASIIAGIHSRPAYALFDLEDTEPIVPSVVITREETKLPSVPGIVRLVGSKVQ